MLEIEMSLVDLSAELFLYNFIIVDGIDNIFLLLSSEETMVIVFLLFFVGELELVLIELLVGIIVLEGDKISMTNSMFMDILLYLFPLEEVYGGWGVSRM
jgi:hypothetical protein